MDLPIDPDLLSDAYKDVTQKWGHTHNLETWGITLESAIDKGYRHTQMATDKIPLAMTKGLPKAYRGRCQEVKPKMVCGRPLTKPHRDGEYQPDMEIHTFCHPKESKEDPAP